MRWELIPEGKFNSRFQLGSEWDENISQDTGLSLALMVSKSLDSISDPVLGKIEKLLGIKGADKLTLADFGCLLFSRFSVNDGSQIYISLPSWCQKYADSVRDLTILMLSGFYGEFLRDFDSQAKWIFPINFCTQDDLIRRFPNINSAKLLKFEPSWILPSGIQKLSRILYELSLRPDLAVSESTQSAIKTMLRRARESEVLNSEYETVI